MFSLMKHAVTGDVYGVNLGEVANQQTVYVLKISVCNDV